MLNLINNSKEETRKFGIGFFDLVIVDEAHRSIYAKYGALFDYFDTYLVGLTATPKNEVDHNTYRMFQLERGVPTFAYSLEDAIREKHLVPPIAVSVPLRFQREGIKYENLSEEEKQQWDELDWGEGDQLTQDGAMNDERLYESPFIDLASRGPTAIFSIAKVGEIRAVLREIRERAVA